MPTTFASIEVFNTHNPVYAHATVYFYTADANGAKTTTLASMYEDAGLTVAADNPQTLDAFGKLPAILYHSVDVIAEVQGIGIAQHDTALMSIANLPADLSAGLVLAAGSTNPRDIGTHLGDVFNVKNFLAVGDGVTDDTTAIQAAIDAAKAANAPLFFPEGTYLISASLKFTGVGRYVFGAGREKTIIKASAGGFDLILWGDPAVDTTGWCQRGTLRDLTIQGHATSTGGLIVGGPTDDNATWTTGSRDCQFSNLRIYDIGNGPCVRNSAWGNLYEHIGCWDSLEGFRVGNQAHALIVVGLYSSSHVNSGLVCPATVASASSNIITFYSPIVQDCGGAGAPMIDIKGGSNWEITGIYTEKIGTGGTEVLNISDNADGVTINGMRYSAASSAVTTHDIIKTSKKAVFVNNVKNYSDCNSILHITGTAPTVFANQIRQVSGTAANGEIFDESTRRAVMGMNNLAAFLPPTIVRALITENALEVQRSDTDAVQWFVRNARMYFGPDTTNPYIGKAGSTFVFVDSDGGNPSPIKVSKVVVGSGNTGIFSGTGTPEGSVTADPGSVYLNISGGDDTAVYSKISGTGNTGWKALENVP